jgi:dATP pyrophosphohydrolase
MRQPIQVLVYPAKFANGHWQYLLLRRIAAREGFWQGVTGGVEGDEQIVDAAKRELAEETGLEATAVHHVDFSYSYPVAERYKHLYAAGVEEITEYVFVAQIVGEETPTIDAREHDRWEWLDLDEALERLTWPSNVEALKQCDRFLRQA